MANNERIRVFCGSCKQDTNHVVLCKRRAGSNPDDEYHWSQNHWFCQCAGCDNFCYAIETTTEDDLDVRSGQLKSAWETFPSREGERQPIDRIYELPVKVRILYKEVVEAVNAQLSILAAVGLRALIEAICKERKVTGRTLLALIDGLSKKGVLSDKQAEILHSHRFLGNVAAHQAQQASREEILVALEIAESMMKTIYILSKLSEEIVTGKPKIAP